MPRIAMYATDLLQGPCLAKKLAQLEAENQQVRQARDDALKALSECKKQPQCTREAVYSIGDRKLFDRYDCDKQVVSLGGRHIGKKVGEARPADPPRPVQPNKPIEPTIWDIIVD